MIALTAGFMLIIIVQIIKLCVDQTHMVLDTLGQKAYQDVIHNPPTTQREVDEQLHYLCKLGFFISLTRVVRDAMYYVDRLSYAIFVACMCWTTVMVFVRLVRFEIAVDAALDRLKASIY